MDYIFFIYGMSFFILASSSLLLIRDQKVKLPWFWLGLFGFTHALNEWLDIFSISVGDNPVFGMLRLTVILLSFVFLAEFSWLSFLALKGRPLSQWFFIPWLLLVYSGWYFGKDSGLNFTCRYFLGFVSSFSAGIILYLHALKLKNPQRRLIATLGLFIGAYSFTQLIISSPPALLNNTLLNQDNFIRFFGFPVQLLRAALIMCAAFTILTYWYLSQGLLNSSGLGKKERRRVLLIGSAYLILAISGCLITQKIGAYFRQSNVDELSAKANTVSAAVNFRRVETLTASAADIGTPDYERLKEQLKAINEANVDLTYVYLMRFDNGRIVFLADSEPDSSANSSTPGQVYEEASPELKAKFLSRRTFIVDAYTDRWGSWISAFAPVVDLRNNKIVALIGMDMDVNIWQQKMFLHRLLGILISFCMFILFFVFFVISRINRASNERIAVSQKHLQTLIDNIPSPVFYKNTQGAYLGCNFAFAQFFGLDKKAVIGKNQFDLNPPGIAEINYKIDMKLFSLPNGGTKIYESEILDAQGIKHIMLLNKSTYPGPDGKIAGLVGVMQDITERKNREIRLLALNRAVEQSPAVVVITDKDGNITYVNPKFVQLTGYGYQEAIGKNPRILRSEEQPREFYKNLWDTILAGGQWRGEFHNKRKDGSLYWESASISPVKDSKGVITNFIAVKEDITERKRILEELKQKNTALEKLDQLKSDFVSMVSHELRTPLSITKEGISLVLDGVTGSINPKQGKILTTSKNNIDRLARIINSLLDISKIESGRVELKKKNVDFRGLIKNVFAAFENKAKEKGLELRINLPKEQGPDLYIDEDRIIQVFTNLIGNAIKFTERGHIDVSLAQKDEEVEFTISDTGIGIAAEDLPKVFNKFLQFGRAAGAGEKGTGLGLSIAKGLIELHRGRIWVESGPGKGTKFIFTLPKYHEGQKAREYIEDAIEEANKANTHLTLVIATLAYSDKIKSISEELMREMEKIIRSKLYRSKDLVLQYPKEFFILMRDCGKNSGVMVQERIEQALRIYFENNNLANEMKLNFGLAVYPDEAINYHGLVNKARGV